MGIISDDLVDNTEYRPIQMQYLTELISILQIEQDHTHLTYAQLFQAKV